MKSGILSGIVAIALCGCVSVESGGNTSFTYASWNIGHFTLGGYSKPRLTAAEGPAKVAAYNAFLDEVGADIMGVCEFSIDITNDGKTKSPESVFGRYRQQQIGPWHHFDWNALFANDLQIVGTRVKEFPFSVNGATEPKYYLATEVLLAGRKVVIVSTHLDWKTIKPEHRDFRARQMQMLIDDFAEEKYVIISGDFNVVNPLIKPSRDVPEEYSLFVAAGYRLGNDGKFKTYPAGNVKSALDNIIVKGFKISDFKVYDRPDLSDHALISARLTLED